MPMVWPVAVASCRELVELADLDGRVGDAGAAGVGLGEASGLGCLCGEVASFACDAKVRLRLGAVVEAEYGFDGADEFGGKSDAAFADAIGGAVVRLVDEGDAEGLLHGGDGAGELDGAAFGARGIGRDGEAELFCEGADELDGIGVGTVVLPVLRVREPLFAGSICGLQWSFALDDDGYGESRCRGCGFFTFG